MQIPIKIGYYAIGEKIGEGNYAEVKLATHTILNTQVALKIINKNALSTADTKKILREVKIMKELHHPNIIRLYQVMEDSNNLLYMVTEHASRGELYSHLLKHNCMDESEARKVFNQILCALEYCHSHNVVHRDIKLENLLLDHNGNVKLADFGFSNFFSYDGKLSTWCGSPSYAAPEIFEGREYTGPEVDIWSAGVVLYTLVSGCLPFDGSNVQELKQRVIKCFYRLHFRISEECSDLIKKMLVYDPSKRYSIPRIRAHKWMESIAAPAPAPPITNNSEELVSVREHAMRKLESKGFDWNTVIESATHCKFDDMYAMYYILEDQLLTEIRSQTTTQIPVISTEHHELPSVGFPMLRQQQELLQQANDWTRGDLAKVPASLSSRSSIGSSQIEATLPQRIRTISGQQDPHSMLHQQYFNYRRHSLDIFTFQNPNTRLGQQVTQMGPTQDLMGRLDPMSCLRVNELTMRRASDSNALENCHDPRIYQSSSHHHHTSGQHNLSTDNSNCLSSVPNRVRSNQGRRFSDGLLTLHKSNNLGSLQELPQQECEEMLPIPSTLQLSPRQQPMRRHSLEPSILMPPGGDGKSSLQRHLERVHEQALLNQSNSSSSSSEDLTEEMMHQEGLLHSRLRHLRLAQNNVQQWQEDNSEYLDTCMELDPPVSVIESTIKKAVPRQALQANILSNRPAADTVQFLESVLRSVKPELCVIREGYILRALWNGMEMKAEVCLVGRKSGIQVHYIGGDETIYRHLSSNLISTVQESIGT